jgi:hypothetical protein
MARPRLAWNHPKIVARFLSRTWTVAGSECIEIEGEAPFGWVRFRANDFPGCAGARVYAHRYAFAIVRGPLAPDTTLDHTCRNRGCVNPYHLEAMTRPDHGRKSAADQWAEEQESSADPAPF